MNTTMLLIIIFASVLVVIIGLVVIGRLLNRRNVKKLDLNLNNLKNEKENLNSVNKIVFPENEIKQEEKVPEQEPLEEFEDILSNQDTFDTPNQYPNNQSTPKYYNLNDFPAFENTPKKKEIDDFDKFMNEHSFSRKVFNKPMIEKIKKLPRDVRILLLSSVFDRIDD